MNAVQRRLLAAMPSRLRVTGFDSAPSCLQALQSKGIASSSTPIYEAKGNSETGCQLKSACFGWQWQTIERRLHSLSNLSSTTTIGGSGSDLLWRQHCQADYQPIKRQSCPKAPGGAPRCQEDQSASFQAFSSARKQSSPLQMQQHRWQHGVATQDDSKFVYKGPLSQAVKNLKRLSIAGCAASLVGGPMMVLAAGGAMPLAAKASIVLTIGGFGVFTTSLLHWFTAPYVHRLVYDRRTGSVEAETINILGQRHISRFHVAEAAYPDTIRPQVTFEVKRRFYYLDADNFNDKQLLAKLSPPDPAGDTNVPSH